MQLSIIVAVAKNNVIGNNNQLIWHLPADLKMFRNLTTGHVIIMGRKTFDSIGKPLPNRTSIVISKDKQLLIDGCIVVNSLTEAIEKAKEIESTEAFIIGGAQIYEQALLIKNSIDNVYFTEVHENFQGDTFFPQLSETEWLETKRESFTKDDKNKFDYSFVKYTKKLK
ncbi:MAG: dihydrofolate reductase [Pseudarcicella sp.]|nr:dihydrofolate reductase [Pseudarcicella sp.]MBP6410738.1 dihydrofolate reductase [Pseudarcicella sp.]